MLEPAVVDVDWMHARPKIECGGGLETVVSRCARRERRTRCSVRLASRCSKTALTEDGLVKETRLAGTRGYVQAGGSALDDKPLGREA